MGQGPLAIAESKGCPAKTRSGKDMQSYCVTRLSLFAFALVFAVPTLLPAVDDEISRDAFEYHTPSESIFRPQGSIDRQPPRSTQKLPQFHPSAPLSPPVTDTSITNLQELDPELFGMLYGPRSGCESHHDSCTNSRRSLMKRLTPSGPGCTASCTTATPATPPANGLAANQQAVSQPTSTNYVRPTVLEAESALGSESIAAQPVAHEERAPVEAESYIAGLRNRESQFASRVAEKNEAQATPPAATSVHITSNAETQNTRKAVESAATRAIGGSTAGLPSPGSHDDVRQYEKTSIPDRHLDLLRRTPLLANNKPSLPRPRKPREALPQPPLPEAPSNVDEPTITTVRQASADDAKRSRAQRMLLAGYTVGQICQALEISEQTFNLWQTQQTAATSTHGRRMRELEEENARLRRLISQLVLEKEALQESLRQQP